MKAEREAALAKKEANEEMRDYFKDKRRKLEEGCEKCSGQDAVVDVVSAEVPVVPAVSPVTLVTGEDGQIYEIPTELLKKNV